MGAAALFLSTVLQTLRRQRGPAFAGQRQFFTQIALVYGSYLLFVPGFVLVLADSLSPWVRERWVLTAQLSVDFLAEGYLVFLTWPAWAGGHFAMIGTFSVARIADNHMRRLENSDEDDDDDCQHEMVVLKAGV